MTAGQRIYPDREIEGAGGAVLRYQGDGNVVLYGPSGPLWASGTSAAAGYFELQADGNAVAYDAAGTPYWASNTSMPGARLEIGPRRLSIVAPFMIWQTPEPAEPPAPPPPTPGTLNPLGMEPNGRYFRDLVTGASYDWREASGFALTARMQAGQHAEVRAWMRAMLGHGITSARNFLTYTIGGPAGIPDGRPDRPGYWDAFTALHEIAGEEGFRLRNTIFAACEPFGATWVRGGSLYTGDVRKRAETFAADVAQRVAGLPHLLELANEPVGTGFNHLDDVLVGLGRIVKREAPNVLLTAGDLNDMDFGQMFDPCFDFVDRHQDRNQEMRWLAAAKRGGEDPFRDGQPRRVPAVSGEWVNLGGPRLDGNTGDPACPYPVTVAAFAGVCRSRQILPTFHWDGGLYCTVPDAETVACLRSWRQVLDAFPLLDDSRWRGSWSREQGNYWNRDAWPGSDDIRDVERHVRDGRGPWRAFGIGAYSMTVAEPRGWDWRANAEVGVERVLHVEDDAYAMSVYRRQS